jgi:hypothetical protein
LCTASATCIASSRVADALQHGKSERGGLAGTGGGLPQQIATLKEQRNGLALDRSRFFVTQRGDCGGELALQS